MPLAFDDFDRTRLGTIAFAGKLPLLEGATDDEDEEDDAAEDDAAADDDADCDADLRGITDRCDDDDDAALVGNVD